jgi:hypothetical protein
MVAHDSIRLAKIEEQTRYIVREHNRVPMTGFEQRLEAALGGSVNEGQSR